MPSRSGESEVRDFPCPVLLATIMMSLTRWGALCASGVLSLLCIVQCAVWRLYLSPLSKFPGPKLAALTMWYEIYYDVLNSCGGLYFWRIEQLHKKYGETNITET